MNFCITGATSGLGSNLFEKLAKNSQYNFFLVSKNKHELEKLKNQNKNTKVYLLDLQNVENTKAIANQIEEDSNKRIDVLICNAAIGSFGSLSDVPDDQFVKDINVNFLSHLILIKKFYSMMRLNNFGHILNISSGASVVGLKNASSYSASKSSMQTLIESLYFENIKNNIFPKNVFPGLIDTDFSKKNNLFGKAEKIPIIKKKNVDKISEIIIKNMFSKKLNVFCQFSPRLAFIIKSFPIIEVIRKKLFYSS